MDEHIVVGNSLTHQAPCAVLAVAGAVERDTTRCLVVAEVSEDGRSIQVDLDMSGKATTSTDDDLGHRIHDVTQHITIDLAQI